MKAFLKVVYTALIFIAGATIISIIYGFVARGSFTPAYIFNGNFIVGAVLITAALILRLFPGRLRDDNLTDHSTFMDRYMEKHRQRQEKSNVILFPGLLIMLITGLIQMLLSAVIK